MDKTVFIFGAGASKADNLPTQAELLKIYFESRPHDDYSGLLRGYFRDFFDIRDVEVAATKWPTFEEALAMVEIAMDKEQSFGAIYSAEKLKIIRDGLVISMGRAIESCVTPDATIHNKFVSKLYWQRHYREDEYTFVSFNYDILLDSALMGLARGRYTRDYGFKLANASPEFRSRAFPKWSPSGSKIV